MNRTYKNTTIAILLACILTMAIGYAVLQQRLDISGTSKITSEFNIQVTGISEFASDGYAETANMDFTPTSATYSTNIKAPGDYMIYEIVIENKGTLDGYFEIAEGGDNRLGNFNITDEDGLMIGVLAVTKTQLLDTTITPDIVYPGVNYLKPGEKAYVYGYVEFGHGVTELPTKKEFSNTFNFNFYTKDYYGDDIIVKSNLLNTITKANGIVTSGNGLYKKTTSDFGTIYTFKTDSTSDVNNYVSIDNELWRIIKMYSFGSNRYSYLLIKDELTVGRVFSTIADEDGFYNNLSYTYSSLNQYFGESSYSFRGRNPETAFMDYIIDTNGIRYTSKEVQYLLGLKDIIDASISTECNYVSLLNGSCKSWLTNYGDTYLSARMFTNAETNSGNIAYLEDGKLIGVNPRDTNYANARKVITIVSYTCDFKVLNSNIADGSINNPYVISTDSNDWCAANT